MKKAFCFTIFPLPAFGKNYALVILVFPQGKKGKGKNEKKHFSASALLRPQKPFFLVFSFSFFTLGKN